MTERVGERERGVCACEVHAAETEISSTYFSLGFFISVSRRLFFSHFAPLTTLTINKKHEEEEEERERERGRERETVRECFNQFFATETAD